MLKLIAENISTHLLSMIVAALLPALGGVAIYYYSELTLLVQQLSPQSLTTFLVILVLLCLTLTASVLYILPSFKYVPKYQFYQHRVNGLYYCPTCRNKKPLSPLKYEKSGWRCPYCKSFYKDPDYVSPKEPPSPSGPQSWMAS